MKNWYAIAPRPDHAQTEISIFDEIGMYGISAKSFITDLSRIPSDHTVLLKIHSPGGEVFDGNAIFNALKRRTADVIIQIEGLAASMATVIALAGDRVRMAANGFYMIHNPWGVAMGDAAEMRDQAELLDKIRSNMVGAYAAKSGQPTDLIEEWMDAETWFTAEEAKAAGFVDEITDALPLAASANRFTRLARFRHAPASLLTPTAQRMEDTEIITYSHLLDMQAEQAAGIIAATVVSENAEEVTTPDNKAPEVEPEPAELIAEEIVEPAPAAEVVEEPQARIAAVDSILAKYNAAIAERDCLRDELVAVKGQVASYRESLERLERSLGLQAAQVVPFIEPQSDAASDPVAEYLAAVEAGDRKAASDLFAKHKALLFAHRNNSNR
jgi:ATP-dependent Clp endopeptidase proteolytic subunit ClpP